MTETSIKSSLLFFTVSHKILSSCFKCAWQSDTSFITHENLHHSHTTLLHTHTHTHTHTPQADGN